MRGTMLWFNLDKDRGVITGDDGTRTDVVGAAFVDGIRPPLRCTGQPVEFNVIVEAGESVAADVAFVPEVAPRRARRRSRQWRA